MDHNLYTVCQALIGDAIHRCRNSHRLCRLTLTLKIVEDGLSLPSSSFQLSISDTGNGIHCKELGLFYPFFSSPCPSTYPDMLDPSVRWGGELLVMTTGVNEEEIHHYQINLYSNINTPSVMQLRSVVKERGSTSGTEVLLTAEGSAEKLLLYLKAILHELRILNIKNIVFEICLASLMTGSLWSEEILLSDDDISLSQYSSNLERLCEGFADHVWKSVVSNDISLKDLFLRNSLKIGKGMGMYLETSDDSQWCLDTCIVVVEEPKEDPHYSKHMLETKVLFFQDFFHASITPSMVRSLKKTVDWSRFGLSVKNIHTTDNGITVMQWDNSMAFQKIEIVLHRYRNNSLIRSTRWPRESQIIKTALQAALNELKDDYPHLFLSSHALEIQENAPELACCIAGLITSSRNIAFQNECAEILGLPPTDLVNFEKCIRDKIFKIIENSDKVSGNEAEMRNHDPPGAHTEIEDPTVEESNENSEEDETVGQSIWDYL